MEVTEDTYRPSSRPGEVEPGGPVLLFDGVCNLCNGTVDFIIRRDGGRYRFGSLQSAAARSLLESTGLDSDYLRSIVLVDGDRVLVGADAVLETVRHLPHPWRALAAVGGRVPRVIRDAVYRIVADRRYRWFGRRDTCRLPTPDEAARFIDG